jgi:tight adherence protein C
MGRRWRDELDALARRLDLRDLRRTVAVLERSESLGTPLKDSLVQLAADVRSSRAALAAEKARKAPVKMLFPLVFLVLPAFLLLTVVPVLLSTLRSLS